MPSGAARLLPGVFALKTHPFIGLVETCFSLGGAGFLMRRRMSGNWVVFDGRLRASASNCRLVPRFIDASRFVLCARWVSVLATYCEGMLPLVVPFLLSLALPAGGRHCSDTRVPDEPHSLWCSFGPRVFARHLGCGTLKGRWVFTASDRPIEALSLDAHDCRARCEPSTAKVVCLARCRRRRGMLPG